MNRSILLAFTLLFFSTSTLAWTLSADFEEGSPGDVGELPTKDAFHRTADWSAISNTKVLTGKQSGSVTAKKGQTGFGKWGGSLQFPSFPKEGDEIWFRVNVFYPTGWDFSCGGCTQGMKFMRIHTRNSSGGHEGYLDNLIKGGTTGGLLVADSEVNGTDFKANNREGGTDLRKNLGTPVQRNQWHTYEMYLKLSSGKGIYRIWQDGNLIFEDLKTNTLGTSGSSADFMYLYTYWNNGAPRTQTSYVDDIVITTDIPSRKDAHGNAFIGVGESNYIADPKSGGQFSGKAIPKN